MLYPRFRIIYTLLFSILIIGCTKDDMTIVTGPDILVKLPGEPSQETTTPENTLIVANEIRWIENMQTSNGLLASTENNDFVSLYDNALAAIVFIETNDLERAEKIFDFFKEQVDSELLSESGGFYQFRNINNENTNRRWMGDNAWLLIALNKYNKVTGSNKYQSMTLDIEDWLRNLQDIDGGLWGGMDENGSVIPKVTEGIITAFNAVKGYDDFHKNILSFLKQQRWDSEKEILLAWPENPEYNHALDLHSLGNLIFEEFSAKNLEEADRYYTTQTSTVNGLTISGYCFDDDKDVVWLEGTAQMAVAYQVSNNEAIANNLILQLEKTIMNSTTSSNSKGLPYTANHGTTFGATSLWDHADLTPTLSTTAWFIFSKMKINPLEHGLKKDIPNQDSFWITD